MRKSDFEIRRLLGKIPLSQLPRKTYQKIREVTLDRVDKYRALRTHSEITDEELVNSLDGGALPLSDSIRCFRVRQDRRIRRRFFRNATERSNIASILRKELSKDVIGAIVKEADQICEHIFDLLGSGRVRVYYGMEAKGFEGYCYHAEISRKESIISYYPPLMIHNYEPIDWHIDFKSGHRWNPKSYYKGIKFGHRLGVDVKIPWELSRFQHLATLGEAYFLSEDEKYATEFVNQVTDWIGHNPPSCGVNWKCTMDVAIRVCNWLLAWKFFEDSPSISNEFIVRFFKSLLQHGRHIENNLEWSKTLTSNHYLSDVVGLFYLGVLIPEFRESKKWKDFGIDQLKTEMTKQVYRDGVHFEASTCYHRLVLELFFYATFLAIINDENFEEDNLVEVGNEIFGEKYLQRLYKMFEFLLYALKPNGTMPQIGDNDSGRLHVFSRRETLDMRYLLTLGAIFFREPKFKVKEFGFWEEALWVFGEKGYKIWQDLEENYLGNISSRGFPDAGWYIMRSNKDYMIISCGPNAQKGNGGHCHNDKLSFELCLDGRDIIVDPGTYVYTSYPEWRNKFRSTAYHNTVVVDNREQNSFNPKKLFVMRSDAEVEVNEWTITNEYDFLDAEHSGYERLRDPVTHRRQILFNKKEGYWVIRDILTGSTKHTFDFYLHFGAMNVQIAPQDPLSVVANCEKVSANLLVSRLDTGESKSSVENKWVSYSYGTKISAPVLKYSRLACAPTAFVIALYPFKSSRTPWPMGKIKERALMLLGQNNDRVRH